MTPLEQAREALSALLSLYKQPGEDADDCFERVADDFYRETGYLRPGKDCRLHDPAKRGVAWEKWIADKLTAARAALAALSNAALAASAAQQAPFSWPRYITFTGADEHTDIDRMVSLSKRYPIEWGVLFSPKRQGQGRYPPLEFVRRLVQRDGLHLSAHLCGADARSALAGHWPLPFGGFERVQINTADPNIDTAAVGKWASRMGLRAILQCRTEFPRTADVAWLFDQSGGRGIEPGAWPKSHATSQCGYAGGIGPDNVLDVLRRIDSTDFWIDMESKVRDENDRFDLDAVERVCQAVFDAALSKEPQALPPLPESAIQRAEWHNEGLWVQYHDAEDPLPDEWDDEAPDAVRHYFSADQMRAYAEQARALTPKE
jgi:hypothetical protein